MPQCQITLGLHTRFETIQIRLSRSLLRDKHLRQLELLWLAHAPDRVSSSAAHHLATAKQRGRERGQTRAEKSGVRAHLCHGGHGEDGHQEQRAAPPHHRRHLRSPRARRPSPTEPARAPAGGDLEGSGRGVASARREVGVGELKRRRRATNAQASREE